GIIALLIAILLPALNKARAAAQAVACASNHRQLLLGLQMYAQEHGGWYSQVRPKLQTVTVAGQTRNNTYIAWYGQPLVGAYIGNATACGTDFSLAQQWPDADVVYCPTIRPHTRGNYDTGIGYNNIK